MLEILKNPHFDFLGKTKYLLTLSGLIIVGGFSYMFANGIYFGTNPKGYGVEFSGGTQLILHFEKSPETERIRASLPPDATIQTYDDPSKNQVLVRLGAVDEHNLDQAANDAKAQIAAKYPENKILDSSTEIVGPTVGADLRQKAIQLTVWGLVFQLLYIGWRFGGAIWGAAATLAVLHDVLVTIALLALFKYEITLNIIAALLTLVGYSVNDTIVIFDRVRENMKSKKREPLEKILNDSINQTLTRTLIASGMTLLAVLGLFLFGGEVLRGFGFTMVVGIIVGTYSTIYIATPIVVWWDKYQARKTKSA
ncbi:MAG: protein translocase subunit SecF [Vicinamibacteria bacterium]